MISLSKLSWIIIGILMVPSVESLSFCRNFVKIQNHLWESALANAPWYCSKVEDDQDQQSPIVAYSASLCFEILYDILWYSVVFLGYL